MDLNMSRPVSYELNTPVKEYLRLADLELYNYYHDYQRNLSNNLYGKGRLGIEVRDTLLRVGGAISKSLYARKGSDF